MMPDPCACGAVPEVKELVTTSYFVACACGNHGPAQSSPEWAALEWKRQEAEKTYAERLAQTA